ncbi:MAG: hypothetical protein ACQEXQ_17270 [Bacillota bacterium]
MVTQHFVIGPSGEVKGGNQGPVSFRLRLHYKLFVVQLGKLFGHEGYVRLNGDNIDGHFSAAIGENGGTFTVASFRRKSGQETASETP